MGATTMQLGEGQRPLSGAGGVMRPKRYRSGTVALREIRFQFYKNISGDFSAKLDRYILTLKLINAPAFLNCPL